MRRRTGAHGSSTTADGAAPSRRSGAADRSHARSVQPGFLAKLILMGVINALGLYGVWTAAVLGSWAVAASLTVGVAVADWLYFSRRRVAGKYLYPGLALLLVFQAFVIAYTGYVAFTNYGDGHNSTKADAIAQISAQNERRVEGSEAYPLTVVARGDDLAFAVVRDGEVHLGGVQDPLHPVDGEADGNRVVAVEGWDVLSFGEVAAQSSAVTELRVPLSDDPAEGSLRTQDAAVAYVSSPVLQYDEDTDTFVHAVTGTTYRPDNHGSFRSPDGEALTPGWRVVVGLEHFTAIFDDSRLVGPFVQILVWTFAFAFLTVVTTFALGLFLAIVFNDPRVRGRKLFRALLILPYAFPGFLATLVWKGMLNERFGFINEVLLDGADIPWLTDAWLARLSVLSVNLWLGFPYMFLICTGALQSLPSDVLESARMDGAGKIRTVRSIVLPLLMVSVAPLLISSFAFNFNNFTLIYMLTGGGPTFEGASVVVGSTDILISMVYAVAFGSGMKQYGLASAVSLMIFAIVGLISWLGFRRTRTLEEL